jgi:hypothetical protein
MASKGNEKPNQFRYPRRSARDEGPTARAAPVDMAEIARRRQQVREATEALERQQEPPRGNVSMAERAARAGMARKVVLDEAAVAREADQRAESERLRQERQQAADEQGPSMAERAADAVRRSREAGGPAQVSRAEVDAGAAVAASVAVVLVTRNHAGRVGDAFAVWRERLDAVDLRWFALDLGSVDATAAEAEAARASLVVHAGGLAAPMQALDALLRTVTADVVVLADAGAVPGAWLPDVIAQVRAGRAVVAAPAGSPMVVAIRRQAWRERPFGAAVDLNGWRALDGDTVLRLGSGGVPLPNGFVERAVQQTRMLAVESRVLDLIGKTSLGRWLVR